MLHRVTMLSIPDPLAKIADLMMQTRTVMPRHIL